MGKLDVTLFLFTVKSEDTNSLQIATSGIFFVTYNNLPEFKGLFSFSIKVLQLATLHSFFKKAPYLI
jgi:hypothetical protein